MVATFVYCVDVQRHVCGQSDAHIPYVLPWPPRFWENGVGELFQQMSCEDQCCLSVVQRHAAWLEEPQELKDLNAGKGEPLLKDNETAIKQAKQDTDSKPAEALPGPEHDKFKTQVARDAETDAGQTEAIDKLDQV